MLRFDRYLATPAHTLDISTGAVVSVMRAAARNASTPALFEVTQGRTLIDVAIAGAGRYEVWERWRPRLDPRAHCREITDFVELLEVAALGVPRAFDLGASDDDHALLVRLLAREARLRGWVAVDVEVLGAAMRAQGHGLPSWTLDRSLVLFALTPGLSGDAVLALIQVARRDVRPHVVVRSLSRRVGDEARANTVAAWRQVSLAHEAPAAYATTGALGAACSARWRALLAELAGAGLGARGQPRAPAHYPLAASPGRRRPSAQTDRGVRMEMAEDFVDVLQMCQDIEDERTALARVAAYVRERLQASSVAFVVREGNTARVLSRVGSEQAPVQLALRSIDTAVAVRPVACGPAEAAHPVRHASEVIGAVWCRWSAGTPVAVTQAATLLGVAAAATAPSLRLAVARAAPVVVAAVPELVGDSLLMTRVREAIVCAAASPFPVVIEGESGSGKELAARAIHTRSARADRRFCPINCAAIVDELVESELFGHARGAFTGAATERAGVFEEAHRGTLFLDEVAELSARVQAKLLRVLQEGEVRRLGETQVRKVDVRVVAATNQPLREQVAANRFRADLWYRLDVIRIALPPLRERLEDLPALIRHLWRTLAERTGTRATLGQSAVAALGAYDWPGNIRELQNVLASVLVSAPRGGVIGAAALPQHIGRAATLASASSLAAARRQFDQRFVRAALARAGGRTAPAAHALGLTRQGLSKLMDRLGIDERRPVCDATARVE